MAQEREISTRIASLGELLEIVSAIRAIAASQMQQAMRSLEAVSAYSEVIAAALADAATLLAPAGVAGSSPGPDGSALVVFCSEHGFCGAFNEHPLRSAQSALAQSRGKLALIVVGSRGAQICLERGLRPELALPMATHCASVTATARRVADEVYRILDERRIVRLAVVYTQHSTSLHPGIERRQLLPLEVPASAKPSPKAPPLINLGPRRLFDGIVAEYFFAALESAAMHSFFSENSTRFRTMEAARQNIRNKSGELARLARRLRQEAVTTEILDLISGTEALGAV